MRFNVAVYIAGGVVSNDLPEGHGLPSFCCSSVNKVVDFALDVFTRVLADLLKFGTIFKDILDFPSVILSIEDDKVTRLICSPDDNVGILT